MRRSGARFLEAAGALALVLVWGCGAPERELYTFTGPTMGTAFTVKVVADTPLSPDRQEALAQAISGQLESVDGKMSTYRPDSELSRFNQYAGTDPFAVSRETLDVFRCARRVSEESGGVFDVTVGPLVNAWGFGPEGRPDKTPNDAQLVVLRERVGYKLVTIDEEAGTIQKARPDVYCDLSAVAKGYGVDQVARALEAAGVGNYMIEVGGEIRTAGRNASGQPWRIAVEKPDPEGRSIQRVIALTGASMATSGDYRNYYEENGIRLSHEIDPRTARPIAHRLASVSVIHKECALADAYATAIMVLGPEDGYAFAVRQHLAAYLLVHDGTGAFTERVTPEFEAYS